MEEFSWKTKVIAGTGAVTALKQLQPKRVYVVTDPFFMENGTARRVADATGAAEQAFFSKIQPDPTVELAAEGTAQLRGFAPDLVVALGGGSAMDCAKAMVYFAGGNCTLAAVPTTSGSGSEITDYAVLTYKGVKHPLTDEKLRPEIAVLDDDLLKSQPKGLVADCGMDVLSHALEAWVARGAGAITDCLAKEAFYLAWGNLPRSYAGEPDARGKVHRAATLAGAAFSQAGLGLCHAMAHSLGGAYHVPHGRLNAILLPAVVNLNSAVAGEKYAALARAVGLDGSADTIALRNLKNGLVRLQKELGLPQTLAEAGVDPGKLRADRGKIVAATLADPCCGSNPVAVDASMVGQVLEAVAGG